MERLPLEDGFGDVLGKAMRGLGLDAAAVRTRAGLPAAGGSFEAELAADPAALGAVARVLGLDPVAFAGSARGGAVPEPVDLAGFAAFTTRWGDMDVNAYLAWDEATRAAVAFDTGADAGPMLAFARRRGLTIRLVLLTHAHGDHVADLARLLAETGAPAWIDGRESAPGAQAFEPGRTFAAGSLRIGTRSTRGHSPGGVTYVVEGLGRPLAIVGDAVFAGSMGGGKVSWAEALATNRAEILTLPAETVLAPGHGPCTTVAHERAHNPFLGDRASAPVASTRPWRAGFVGTGRMGANMARRLRDRGYPVAAVFDRHGPTAEAVAAELGTVAAASPAEVARAAEVVFTVVTDDAAQRSLFRPGDPDSLLAAAAGRVFVNCATLSPAVHVETEAAVRAAGGESLEASMASSIPQARAGTLYLMCAGRREVFDDLAPLLADLSDGGRLLRHVGPAGAAGTVKALVNMVMNINTAGLAEGLGLGVALGVDPHLLAEIFSQTGANSRVLQTDGADMIARDHACFFSAAHAAKDSGIALELARAAGVETPLAAATKARYDRLVALGLGDLDKSAIAELTFPGRAGA